MGPQASYVERVNDRKSRVGQPEEEEEDELVALYVSSAIVGPILCCLIIYLCYRCIRIRSVKNSFDVPRQAAPS